MKYSRIVPVLPVLLGLASCADQPLTYVPPPGLTAQTGASITGSRVVTGSLANNEKVFVGEVDNQVTTQNGSNLQTPLLVSPGLHVLQINACECGGFLTPASGSVSVAVNLQPGQSYVARAGVPSSQWLMFDPNKSTMAWLEDGTGKPAAAPVQITLTQPQQSVFIVPIFIPAR